MTFSKSRALIASVDTAKPSVMAVQRLLHVNNPVQLLRLVEKFCQSRKVNVDSLESASAAFHYALVKSYQLILIGVPTSGIDLMRFLNGIKRAKISTPVVLMAENRLKDKMEISKFPGCIGILTKPLDLSELAKYLEILNKPLQLEIQEKEKLIALLRKWEIRMSNAA